MIIGILVLFVWGGIAHSLGYLGVRACYLVLFLRLSRFFYVVMISYVQMWIPFMPKQTLERRASSPTAVLIAVSCLAASSLVLVVQLPLLAPEYSAWGRQVSEGMQCDKVCTAASKPAGCCMRTQLSNIVGLMWIEVRCTLPCCRVSGEADLFLQPVFGGALLVAALLFACVMTATAIFFGVRLVS